MKERSLLHARFKIGKKHPLCLLMGPCVIESRDFLLATAERLKKIAELAGCQLVFKASYDKANRTSIRSFRGPGPQEGLKILEEVGKTFDLPLVTDVHSPAEAKAAADVVDILQIPAFLCRQTDLIVAAAETGRVVEVKKGQFSAPWDMLNVVQKIEAANNRNILLVDRGTCFGYNNLVVDMRSFPIMQEFGYPVGFDATHAVQIPGGAGDASSGDRRFVVPLANAALGAGADFLFLEAHPNPQEAFSDKETQIPLDQLLPILHKFQAIRAAVG